MKLTDEQYARAANCIHEAGHAVAAVLAGAQITECWASATGGRVAFTDAAPQHHAGIGWAGPYAELLFVHGGTPPPDARREAFANASDEDKALLDGRMARHIERDVEFAMPAIRRLAATLYRKGSARTPDISLALGVRPGVDLDMIRHLHRQRVAPGTIRPAAA
ncbi:hypothetical protein [Nocardia cyriacigeorgica]|uniref:Peptidase M41 domain-containing protein n=1 Tax=Nocardia cyriacigeorgica (strain GUH-2) TaxID=1127134 RepID=H6R9V7_NOCCG|nr:hypothetical protein [Nocardia cyriacigeorgica]CCF61165.1 protein of unknown function [Nocardia cyriacigeorgica GUH-2]